MPSVARTRTFSTSSASTWRSAAKARRYGKTPATPKGARGGLFVVQSRVRGRVRSRRRVEPRAQFLLGDVAGKARALQPRARAGQRFQPLRAAGNAAAAGGAEGVHGQAGQVAALHKGGEDARGFAVPDGKLKCSPSSPALENTGLNGLHKCVFCSF